MRRFSSFARFKSSSLPLGTVKSLSVVKTSIDEPSSHAQSVILAKYFDAAPSISTDSARRKEDVQNAINTKDNSQLSSLIRQFSSADLDQQLIDNIMFYCISTHNHVLAVETLLSIEGSNLAVSEHNCQALLVELSDHLQINLVPTVLKHMIQNKHNIPTDLFGKTISGLFKGTNKDVIKALELLHLIIEFKRLEFTLLLTLPKHVHFHAEPKDEKLLLVLQSTISASLKALELEGWYAANVHKALSGIALHGGYVDLALEHLTKSLDLLSNLTRNRSTASNATHIPTSYDVLQHLCDFIPCLVNTPPPITSRHSEVSLTLLGLLLDRVPDFHLQSHNGVDVPRRCVLFLGRYLSLANRCIATTLNADMCIKVVPPDVLDEVHERAMDLYNLLLEFNNDNRADSKLFKIQPGYDRRVFRHLCTEFHFTHQMVSSSRDDTQIAVKVIKPSGSSSNAVHPKSYLDIMVMSRKIFDGEPLYWRQFARQHLSTMNGDLLMRLSVYLMKNMVSEGTSSVSWGLLWWEELRKRDMPAPAGFVGLLLQMCNSRSDVYGVIEVLQMAKMERRRQQNEPAYFEKYKAVYERLYAQSSGSPSGEIMPLIRKEVVELFPTWEWSRVFKTINSSHGLIWQRNYNESYTELVGLMKDFDAEMDSQSLQTFLEFLVRTHQVNDDMLQRLIRRLMSDEAYPFASKDCASLSHYLLSTVPVYHRKVLLTLWGQMNNLHYLTIHPEKLNELKWSAVQKLEALDVDPTEFEEYWAGLQSSLQCRRNMLKSLSGLANSSLNLTSNKDTFDVFSQVVLYTAYLLCSHDGEYRSAFRLLADWSLLKPKR